MEEHVEEADDSKARKDCSDQDRESLKQVKAQRADVLSEVAAQRAARSDQDLESLKQVKAQRADALREVAAQRAARRQMAAARRVDDHRDGGGERDATDRMTRAAR